MLFIVDVLSEAQPDSLELIPKRIQELADKEDLKIDGTPSFLGLQEIPRLHFISLQIFEDDHFDPLLVVENNLEREPKTYRQSVAARFLRLGDLSSDYCPPDDPTRIS